MRYSCNHLLLSSLPSLISCNRMLYAIQGFGSLLYNMNTSLPTEQRTKLIAQSRILHGILLGIVAQSAADQEICAGIRAGRRARPDSSRTCRSCGLPRLHARHAPVLGWRQPHVGSAPIARCHAATPWWLGQCALPR